PISLPSAPFSRAFDFAKLDSWITPNSEFFLRSHFGTPRLDVADWTVTVTGAVNRDRTFAMDELFRFPRVEEVVTLECAGNPVGWGGVSNARWTGVSVATMLELAGVNPEASEIVFVGSDGGEEREAGGIQVDAYARSIPLSKALQQSTMLAYRMNNEPLPDQHGGPLRALVPGWYGSESVKWLRRIVVSKVEFKGWYQLNRYYEARRNGTRIERTPVGPVRIKSQIARPSNGSVLSLGVTTIAGAAWCGDAEVTRVELSFDGGRTWVESKLGSEHEPRAWRLWSYDWRPRQPGRYEIVARATDSRGRLQPLERDSTIVTPYANNWCDRRRVEVR